MDTDSDGETDYHWGSYRKCYGNTTRNILTRTNKDSCETLNATWSATEVYGWRPANNTMTFRPGAAFQLSARGAGKTSVDLRRAKQAGADEYVIYSAAYDADNPDIPFKRLAGLVTVSADTTEYHYEGVAYGEKRHYLIRARKDGRPIAMGNPVVPTAETRGCACLLPRRTR